MTVLDTFLPFAGQSVSQARWEQMFDGFGLLPGVLRGEANQLAVAPSATALTVTVDTGSLVGFGHHGDLTSMDSLTLDAPDADYTRIDRVVGFIDHGAATIGLDVITGTPAAVPPLPALEHSAFRWDVPLAEVTVAPGAGVLAVADVVDARLWAVPAQGAGGAIVAETVAADAAIVCNNTEQAFPGWAFPVAVQADRRYWLRLLFHVATADAGGANGTTIKLRFRDGSLTGDELYVLGCAFTFAVSGFVRMNCLLDDLSEGLHTIVVTGHPTSTDASPWTLVGATAAGGALAWHPVPWFVVEDCGPL